MAETSSTTSSTCFNGSPIHHLAQDQLFTILLLLPVDSVLSFSSTCKRFRSLTCSDSLWESICRRDWGCLSVDVLKSSANRDRLPWMRIFKQVSKLDSVCCHKMSDLDGSLVIPSPRASHSLNFVSDYLVLFGGGCEGGRHLDDTWIAYAGNSFQSSLKWEKINSGIPSGRFGHTCVTICNQLVLFGGINDRGDRQNDTWVGQITSMENGGATLSWRLLEVGSLTPSSRGAHAACCIDNRKMVMQGGIGLQGVRLGDTWVLELSENLGFGTWHEILTHPEPPPRSGHTLTCIRGTQTILFGGRGLGYDVLSDVWLLETKDGQAKWIQLLYEFQTVPGGASLPRVGHSATLILGGRLLIYGGEDSYRHRKDDFWLLDVNGIRSIEMQPDRLNLKGLLSWKRVQTRVCKPKRRSFHRACIDNSGRYIYVLGGMVDGILHHGEAPELRFDAELFMVELGLQL